MRPLKVTCWLNSPLASEPPRLDALLEWAMSLRMRSVLESSGGHKHQTGVARRGEPVVPGKIPIPLARIKVNGYPHAIPLCSDPILPSATDGVEKFARRYSTEFSSLLEPTERKVVTVSSGEFKSHRLPLRVRPVDRIVWFCAGRHQQDSGPSPGKEVRKLLTRDVHAVGKKISQGFGQVARWEVELIDDDYSWFAPSEHGPVLMRTLPACAPLPTGLIGYKKSFGAPVAPYWMPENYTELVVPC